MAWTNTHSTDLELDSDQYWSVTDNAPLSIVGDMSISLYVKPESAPGANTNRSLVSKYTSTGDQRSWDFGYRDLAGVKQLFILMASDGTVGTVTNKGSNGTLTSGTWYQVGMVYRASAGEVEFYINGASIGTTTGNVTSIFNGTSAFIIGDTGNGDENWDGLIDDVRIWARALSDSDMTNIAAAPGIFSNGANLQGWWKFNNDGTDSSGNASTLTNNNVATFTTEVYWDHQNATEVLGTPVEAVSFTTTQPITASDVAGAPVDAHLFRYGFGNQTKSSTSWTNSTKH